MGIVLHLRTIRLQSHQTTEESNNLKGQVKVERQLVRFPWAADCCPCVENALEGEEEATRRLLNYN
jgi:hypothetical protein